MRKAACILSVLVLLLSCGRARVIPRGTLSDIYVDMLVADQWVKNDRKFSRMADTSDVYAGILGKYGYDVDDYRRTVDRYMSDPEEFSRIFEKTEEKLNARLEAVKRAERLKVTLDSLLRVKREREYPSIRMAEEQEPPYLSDSLAITLDSLGYPVIRFATADTMYLGPAMVISDSILRRDSIMMYYIDSLTFAGVDSLRFDAMLDSLLALHYPVDTVAIAPVDSLLSFKPDSIARHAPDSVAIDTAARRIIKAERILK